MDLVHVPNRNPSKPNKQHLLNLPHDVIFGHSEILNSSDLLNVTRTCKALHSTIPTYFLYRHIRFQIPDNEDEAARMQKFLRVLKRHPERASWVREAEFTWNHATTHRWFAALRDIVVRLSSLHTLEIRTTRRLVDDEIHRMSRIYFLERQEREARHCASFLRSLHELPSLRNLTIDDPTLMATHLSQLSSLSQVRQLRVSWGYGEEKSQELNFLVEDHQGKPDEPFSGLTKLELLTELPPVGILVDYVLKKNPALKELSWIVRDQGDKNTTTPIPLLQALEPLQNTLVELQLPSIDSKTFMTKKLLNFAQFSVLKTLRIHGNNMLPFFISQDKQGNGCDFAQRLPASLEVLEVLFNESDWAKMQDGTGRVTNYGWLLSLASHKGVNLHRLTEVTLRLRTKRERVVCVRLLENTIWRIEGRAPRHLRFPENLTTAFRTAGIKLKQMRSIADTQAYYPVPNGFKGNLE